MKSLFAIVILFFSNSSVIQTGDVKPYPDNSLYVEQYQSVGMPSPDVVWHAAEYKRAVKVTKDYYNIDKWSVPRKDSEYSGALFERMTNIENFEIIADKNQNIQERLREHDELLRAIGQLMSMYVEPYETTQRFGIEGLTLKMLSARTSIYSIGVLTDLQKMMLDKGQRNSDLDLMANKLVGNVSTTIEEYLSIIENDYYQYQEADLVWFANELLDWSIEMKDYLSDAHILELKEKLEILKKEHSNSDVRKAMKKMQSSLS